MKRTQQHAASRASCGQTCPGGDGCPVRRTHSRPQRPPTGPHTERERNPRFARAWALRARIGRRRQPGGLCPPTARPCEDTRDGLPARAPPSLRSTGGPELILVGPPTSPPAHAPASAGTSAEPSTAALATEDGWVVTWKGEAPRSGLLLIIPSVFPSRCSLRLISKSTARPPLAPPDRDPAKCHQTGRLSYVSPPRTVSGPGFPRVLWTDDFSEKQ